MVRVTGIGLISLAACGPANPDPKDASSGGLDDDLSAADSAEWLYATGSFSGDERQQCQHVRKWVLGEMKCQEAVCRHGHRLARDWLKQCEKVLPKAAAEIKEVSQQLAARANQAESPCAEQLVVMLRDGCRNDEACEQHAQEWVTRCGPTEATPLVVEMLEKTIEQTLATPRPVHLDGRHCEELAANVRAAAACDQRFKCQDELPKLAVLRERCMKPESAPLAPADGIALLSVLQGAEQTLEPVVVAPTPVELSDQDAPVRLANGKGAVLAVCDQRVRDLAKYWEARQGCVDGEVIVVQLFDAPPPNRTLRVGVVPHANDATFARRFPSLLVAGEAELRKQVSAKQFAEAVDEAARLGGAAGVSRLSKALATHRRWLGTSQKVMQLLAERDAALVPLFAALGKRKQRAPKPMMAAERLVPLARRSQQLPLADVNADGRIELGACTAAAAFDFREALPQSLSKYRAGFAELSELGSHLRVVKRNPPPLVVAMRKHAAACGAAQIEVSSTEQSLLGCAFGVEQCSEKQVAEAMKRQDDAQSKAELAYARALVARAGLSDSERKGVGALVANEGCSVPWW
jgi:hypothetical protein